MATIKATGADKVVTKDVVAAAPTGREARLAAHMKRRAEYLAKKKKGSKPDAA